MRKIKKKTPELIVPAFLCARSKKNAVTTGSGIFIRKFEKKQLWNGVFMCRIEKKLELMVPAFLLKNIFAMFYYFKTNHSGNRVTQLPEVPRVKRVRSGQSRLPEPNRPKKKFWFRLTR
jgi:hypothetical protein